MKNAVAVLFSAVAIFACFCGSFANLNARATHADESEQAATLLKLDRTGEYKYNPDGPHGPALYYWAEAAVKFFGAEIGIRNLRIAMLPALGACIAAFFLLAAPIGFAGATMAAAFFAITSSAQIYGAYFVHEILFALSVFLCAFACVKFAEKRTLAAAFAVGLFAGFAQTCKETSVIAFASFAAGAAAVWAQGGFPRPDLARLKNAPKFLGAAAAGFALVFVPLYSSFGENPAGLLDAFKSYAYHFLEKSEMAEFDSGWDFYLKLLFVQKSGGAWFGEIFTTSFALAGTLCAAFGKSNGARCALFFGVSAAAAVAVLSSLAYKTPWLILSPLMMACVPAGWFLAKAFDFSRAAACALCIVAAVAYFLCPPLSNNAVVRFNSDPRNPFIFSHTVSDENNLLNRILECAKCSEYGGDIPIAFVGKVSPWPLPWQLRRFPNAGFWESAPENLRQFEVVMADVFTVRDVAEKLGKGYVSDLFGLRKNTIITLFIKREIFERIVDGK